MRSDALSESPRIATRAMLRAGRQAFMIKRAVLSDLEEFFDTDLDEFLDAIYAAMSTAASTRSRGSAR